MATPLSNTHLRVPRGFGAILEGLTREILRDQPKDIPKYAANYFEVLLKQRDDSGTDPSEWAAKLEDRYYNNYSFKIPDFAPNIKSQDFTSEDHFGQSEEDVSHGKGSLTITHQESVNGPPVSNEVSAASTQADRSPDDKNTSTDSSHTICHSDSETHEVQLLSEAVDIDVSAQELEGESEDDDQQFTDPDKNKPKNVNVVEQTEDEEAIVVDEEYANTEQEYSPRLESPVSQLDNNEHPLQEEETSNGANEVVAWTEDPVDSNIDTFLRETSFEDVPESQQTINNEDEQLVHVKTVETENDGPQEVELEMERREATEDDKEANYPYDFDDKEDIADIMDTVHQSINEVDNTEDEYAASAEDKSSQKDDSEKYDIADFTEETNLSGDDTNVNETECVDDLEEGREEEQQLDDNFEKYLTTSQELHSEEEEEPVEKVMLDSQVQEGLQVSLSPDLEEWADQVDTSLQDILNPEREKDDQQEECSRPQEEEDIMDIPLDDPEANRAAAKIQAGFRGHMTRKKMKPEDKAEGEEVSSTGEVLNGSQGGTETGGSGPVGRDDTTVPEQ